VNSVQSMQMHTDGTDILQVTFTSQSFFQGHEHKDSMDGKEIEVG